MQSSYRNNNTENKIDWYIVGMFITIVILCIQLVLIDVYKWL
jgi:hypothetical protein